MKRPRGRSQRACERAYSKHLNDVTVFPPGVRGNNGSGVPYGPPEEITCMSRPIQSSLEFEMPAFLERLSLERSRRDFAEKFNEDPLLERLG